MSHYDLTSALRPEPDAILRQIADYVFDLDKITGDNATDTARLCLMDTLGCGLLALNYPACVKMLGPVVPGATMQGGARVPGTSYELDPVQAAFNIGAMVRWLDFNDTWLAAEWGHPSDNLGGILAVADYFSRKRIREGEKPLTVRDVLLAMIQAHEIQGVIALENGFNRFGLDHVLLVRIASTAVITRNHSGRCDTHQEDMIKAKTVKAIFQSDHSLNFVRLDHRKQDVTNRERLFTFPDPLARKIIRYRKDAAEVIGWMPPLRSKPGVVVVEPAHHRTDVESGLDWVQLVRGARNPRATLHRGSGNDRTEHFDAGRVIEGQQPAAKRIH